MQFVDVVITSEIAVVNRAVDVTATPAIPAAVTAANEIMGRKRELFLVIPVFSPFDLEVYRGNPQPPSLSLP